MVPNQIPNSADHFSTFQVSRIMDLDRTRLQEWIDRGFFTPFQKASGKGTKALFNREDVYRLRLFVGLLSWIGSRSRAAHALSNINFKEVGPGKDEFKYLILKVPMGKNFVSGDLELLREKPEVKMGTADLFWMIINLQAIKNDVDRLLEKG